jgi:hypothetical protein
MIILAELLEVEGKPYREKEPQTIGGGHEDNCEVVLDAHPHETSTTDTNDHQHSTQGSSEDVGRKRREFIDLMMSDESAELWRTPFFNQKDLHKRGWSEKLIAQLLGEPDWKTENPHFAGAAPMKCWRQDRVKAIEDSPEFQKCSRRRA